MQSTTLDEAGQTPTNSRAFFAEGQWWMSRSDGERRTLKSHLKRNAKRMYVDGKYIHQAHPLWKSGRYSSFNDAAFSSLKNYPKSTIGCVYVIENPAWPEWVKVGKAIDAEARLNSYQTSDPFRAYILHHHIEVPNRHESELKVHQELELVCDGRRNEWFKINLDGAVAVLNKQHTG
jgi:hypothetical protein